MSQTGSPKDNLQRTEAVLFGVATHGDQRTAAESLDELQLLAKTGEFSVSGCLVQHRKQPDPNSYLGSGKVTELAEIVGQVKAGAVICDDSLSPGQGRAIEKVVQVPVLDRSELILHIFGTHARSTQAMLQVELAALQYELPRLKRRWTHLERQRGGIGLRGGAGEKQIDVDRNLLRTRISQLSQRLKKIEGRKSREISSRPEMFSIAIVGYTNAGKSSLMNHLTGTNVRTEDQLFSTLDTRTKPWRLPGGRKVLVSDTVGFIRKLPHQLVASFHATLEEALNADLLFLVVDGSNPESLTHTKTVESVLEQLDAGEIPRVTVINKVDAVEDQSLLAGLYLHDPNAVAVSALKGTGIENLHAALQIHLGTCERHVEILVPHTSGSLRADIRSKATVLSEFFTEQGCLMEILISPTTLGNIMARGAVLSPSG